MLAILAIVVDSAGTGIRRIAQAPRRSSEPRQDMKPAPDEVFAPEEAALGGAPAPVPVAPLVRESDRVRLRRHTPANRGAFQRWYADPEIAYLLRHDLKPLNDRQSRGYFDSIILPLSATGYCFAIHDQATDQLIGTAALTGTEGEDANAMLFRIVIGEKEFWDKGLGAEATKLVVEEAFDILGLEEVRLEVFAHNPRAIHVYERVGFERTGEHTEWMGPDRPRLHVFEMSMHRPTREEPAISTGEGVGDAEHPFQCSNEPAVTDPI